MAKTLLGTFGGGSSGLPKTKVYSDGSTSVVSSGGGGTTSTPKTTTTKSSGGGSSSSSYSGGSVVDYLDSIGQASDKASRAKLAAQYGITDYNYTAEQNTRLLNALRGGSSGGTTTAPVTTTTLNIPQGLKDLGYVSADQKEIDAYNAEMGISPTPAPVTTNTAPSMTPADFSGFIEKEDQDIIDAEERVQRIKEELAKPETDEEMRTRLTALFQQEIDALNAVYAQQKVKAAKIGLAKLNTNYAIQGRYGMLNTGFGEAMSSNIQNETEQNKADIDALNQAALSPIYSKITDEILAASKEKKAARLDSVESHLANIKSKKEKDAQIATNAIKNMLLSGVNPTDRNLEDMARQIGVDPAKFKREYLMAKRANEAEELKTKAATDKAKAEADKTALEMLKMGADMSKPFAAGGYIFQFNTNTGNVEQIGSARSVNDGANTGKNYDAKTIPATLKASLLIDAQAKDVTLFELAQAYPEVNTDYLQDLLD